MEWNYQILKTKKGFEILEVYKDTKGKITMYANIEPRFYETKKDLIDDLRFMYEDTKHLPVLEEKDLPS